MVHEGFEIYKVAGHFDNSLQQAAEACSVVLGGKPVGLHGPWPFGEQGTKCSRENVCNCDGMVHTFVTPPAGGWRTVNGTKQCPYGGADLSCWEATDASPTFTDAFLVANVHQSASSCRAAEASVFYMNGNWSRRALALAVPISESRYRKYINFGC